MVSTCRSLFMSGAGVNGCMSTNCHGSPTHARCHCHMENRQSEAVSHTEKFMRVYVGVNLMNRQVLAGPKPSRAYLAIGHGWGRVLRMNEATSQQDIEGPTGRLSSGIGQAWISGNPALRVKAPPSSTPHERCT